jgi:hypothetical protein
MEPLVLTIPNAAWLTSKEVVKRNKMSTEDFSVNAPTEEPHSYLHSQPPQQATNPNMHTQPPPSYLHTSKKPNPLYTKTPLPPVPLNSICLLWNNTNALQIENETTLANSINNYLKHEPTSLGLIETKQNFRLYDQMTKPL